MLFALLTLACWSLSAYASSRIARNLGALTANRLRLAVAVPLLGAWALLRTDLTALPGVWWFLLGGVFHLGLGDMALYAAYRHLGPRLGILVCLGLAAPLSGLIEWWWMGTVLTPAALLLGAGVLLCVAVAMAPAERLRLGARAVTAGLLAGGLGAVGQALGAVATRQGCRLVEQAGASLDLLTAAFLRTAGGLAVLLLVWIIPRRATPTAGTSAYAASLPRGDVQDRAPWWPWLIASAVCGPILGMAAYQGALARADAWAVQAVLATLPIAMLPLTWLVDGDCPSRRSLLGGLAAAACVAALALAR